MTTSGIVEYRKRVLAAHPKAFALHTTIGGVWEDASKTARAHPTVVHVVLDMLMMQAMKSHATVSLLAQHGVMEDAATIARRLMELSVQSVYVGADDNQKEREKRAGKYLAFLWRQFPRRMKQQLPEDIRGYWSGVARKFGRFVPLKAKTWGPNWRDMFKEIGHERTYLDDYSFLSAIAHGRPDNQIITFSQDTIKVHSHDFASVLLHFASRYYLIVAEQWNRVFEIMAKGDFEGLVDQVNTPGAWY